MSEHRYPHMSTTELRQFRESLSDRAPHQTDGLAVIFMWVALGFAGGAALLGFVAHLGGLALLSWILFALAIPPAGLLLVLLVTQGSIADRLATAGMRRSVDRELARREGARHD